MKKIAIILSVILSICLIIFSVNAQESYHALRRPCVGRRCHHHVLPPPEIIFIPRIIVRPNYKQMTIQDLSIKADIIGNVATTTYEMVIHNPNMSTLEAEFEFPLNENQTVAAIALDIGGKMREGVVVEKEKARQTFEAVVRQGADPLLVEKTAGNQFKTRIYPFAPNGTRRIRVVLEEPLQKENGQFKYVLPLNFQQKLSHFALDINLPTEAEKAPQVTTDIPDFRFTRSGQVFQSHFEATDYDLNNALSFNIPKTEGDQIFAHRTSEGTYFYGNIDLEKSDKPKVLPKKIAIVWDSSLSGSKRNIAKEKELLTAYLKQLKNISVVFVPFSIDMGKIQNFSVKNGNSADVIAAIDQIVYDGATRFDKLDLNKLNADEILLFTDGLNTFGKNTDLTLPNKPVYTVNSSTEYAVGQMKGWASKTFASFVNLTQLNTEQALSKLTRQPLRIIEYKGKNITKIYPAVGTEADENISIAGVLNGPATDLEVVLGYDKKHIQQTKKMSVPNEGDNPAVERLWAQQKIAYLEQDAEKNKDDILALGQKYSIVTENTSLLVLENASDYFRYHIDPPAELQAEYNRIKANQENDTKAKKGRALQDALRQANRVKEWWNRKFDTTPRKKFEPLKQPEGRHIRDGRVYADTMADSGSYSFADTMDAGTPHIANGRSRRSRHAGGGVRALASAGAADFMGEDGRPAKDINSQQAGAASIQIKQWDPDVPYLKILKASKDSELYADYLKLKTGYSDQPSFYFDITDEFIRRNQYQNGLKILSNVVEMKLDNVELIRIAANKLLQMNEYEYAVELFEKITKLRGEDPQSFRDLALAYQAKGDYQKAFDTFYHILENDWDRFNEIKQIIFVEMNNLLSLHPEVDTKDMNKEFIFNMPVDVRIVLAWSTDNTDIDLHVIDPYNEECYYNHKETQIGGRYPFDFTQGFGPEEFMLKKAEDGKYVIRTNNFGDHRQSISGPTTLYLDLYTNYARPNQKHERVFVRTENVKEKNAIGEIVWGKDSK